MDNQNDLDIFITCLVQLADTHKVHAAINLSNNRHELLTVLSLMYSDDDKLIEDALVEYYEAKNYVEKNRELNNLDKIQNN